MFDQERQAVEEIIQIYLHENDIPAPEGLSWRNIPFGGEWGIATSFFQVAAGEARSGKNIKVPVRAQELAETVRDHLGVPQGFIRVEARNGYLNLYFETSEFSRRVIDMAIDQVENYGRGTSKKELVMVEFSQPNTHKALHVGHLRSMMLGDALANILEFAGYDVLRANYLGDYGKDVIKWIWNFRKRHSKDEKPEKDVTRWMGDLYAEATQMLEKDAGGEKEILELFSRWEARDEEIYNLWQETRQWSLDGFLEVYTQLKINFDEIYFESEMEAPGKQAVRELINSEIAIDERSEGGPVIVKLDDLLGLDDETFGVIVLMRSDGTTLYGAWDMALAKQKFKDYPLTKSIYVVDVRQSLHFKQIFKILELSGWEQAEKVQHLPFELVTLPGNVTLSSREGVVVHLEELIREATQRAYEVSVERNPELDKTTREQVTEIVGIGAIKYPLLARDNTKLVTFDWETALDFNGHAAPYIQYAFVRTSSLLKRAGEDLPDSTNLSYELDSREIELIELLGTWPEVVQRAARELKTLTIANYAYHLAKAFNEFYNHCPVLQAEPDVRAGRLRLVAAAQQGLRNSLKTLGIEVPEVM